MSLQERKLPGEAGYVVATAACLPEHLAEVGGKAVGLGKLIRAGQRVPSSFVVTASAYSEHVRSIGPDLDAAMPDSIRAEIEAAYAGLCESRRRAEVTVAVRSSATIEDTTEASCAGQFRTFLGARTEGEVVAEVERCFTSAFAPNVASYRFDREIAPDASGVAVIVQELVDARSSGVMFTRHPRTGDRSLIVIESSYGLGEAVVGGEVTPDLVEVNKITGQVHDKMIGSKLTEHRLSSSSQTVELRSVADERRRRCSITDDEIEALVQMATKLEGELGKGLDIEWAIGAVAGTGTPEELFALQVRPITVDPRQMESPIASAASARVRNPIDHVLGRLSGRGQ
jgi:pyruvate,water dikinase